MCRVTASSHRSGETHGSGVQPQLQTGRAGPPYRYSRQGPSVVTSTVWRSRRTSCVMSVSVPLLLGPRSDQAFSRTREATERGELRTREKVSRFFSESVDTPLVGVRHYWHNNKIATQTHSPKGRRAPQAQGLRQTVRGSAPGSSSDHTGPSGRSLSSIAPPETGQGPTTKNPRTA